MSGITSIIEIINKKTADKEKEIIQEAEKLKKIKLEEAKKKADEAADAITKKAELQAKAELSRYEATAKLKSKYQLLQSKEQLIEDVLETATQKLNNIVGKEEYKKVLAKLAIEGGISLNSESLELVLPKNHASYIDVAEIEKGILKVTKNKIKIAISKDTVRSNGGLIIRIPDRTKWVDNTFEARLERLEKKVRTAISGTLFETEHNE